MLNVKVFEKGGKNATLAATGINPADMAEKVSARLPASERVYARNSLEAALKLLADRKVPNLTNMSLDIAGRRIRVGLS